MNRNPRFLALFLALFISLTVLLPATALAGPSAQTTFDGFINEINCDQFRVYEDSNSFQHAYSDFPSTYQISEKYLNQLLNKGSFSDQLKILTTLERNWEGSCYGIASTMVLNKLAKIAQRNPSYDVQNNVDLHIEEFQPGAQKYFDLGIPKNNPSLLNMINYYMGAQNMKIVLDAATDVKLYTGTGLGAAECQAADAKLNDFILAAKIFINAGKPVLFSYYYPQGGHAIVLCDYSDTVIPGSLVFKLYDENDRTYDMALGRPRYCYLEIKEEGGQFKAKTDLVTLHYFDYQKYTQSSRTVESYTLHPLSSFRLSDIGLANQSINIHDPSTGSITQTAGNPEFRFSDIQNSWPNYAVKPFVKSDGDIMASVRYADNTGIFYYDLTLSGVPFPINATAPLSYYRNLNDFSYFARDELQEDENKRILDLMLDHNTEGDFSGNNETFDGYDIITSCGKTADFTVSKENGGGAGSFAYVSGQNIGTARFDADGRLRKIESCSDSINNMELFFGSYGTVDQLDMVRLYGNGYHTIKLYDEKDDSDYADCIVLYFDQLPRQTGLQFFKGALVSPDGYGLIGDEVLQDAWIKINAKNVDDQIQISAWSTTETDGGGKPKFNSQPDFVTELQHRDSGDGTVSDRSAIAVESSRFRFLEGENGTWTGGDYKARIDAPLSKYVSTSIDGVSVPRESLDVSEGSTVVVLKEAYLSTLKPGLHLLRVQFTNGCAQTTLTIGETRLSTAAVPEVPATDGGTGAALLCLIPSLFLLVWKKKK